MGSLLLLYCKKMIEGSMKSALVILALGAVMSLLPARAVVLAEYTFTGSVDTSGDADALSNAGDFTPGSGIASGTGFATADGTGNLAPSRQVAANVTTGTLDEAISGNDYFEFSLTPVGDATMTLTGISLDFAPSFSNAVSRSYEIRSSRDGYGSTILSYTSAVGSMNNAFVNQSATLSGALYTDIATTTTFRIYVYDGAGASTSYLRFDNVIVQGTASAVPEPSVLLLMWLGVLMTFRGRRR